jgi:Periplasmic copper-binding protein (NosD)
MPTSPCVGNASGATPYALQPEPAAGMAELVDALDSKSSSGNRVGVRFPLPAPNSTVTAPIKVMTAGFRVVSTLVVLGIASHTFATTFSVPGSSPTIQGAINLAASGDTIVVSAGMYPEAIDFNGKNILVRSTSGPAVTSIAAIGATPVVQFHTGETTAATIDGFTITNGKPGFTFPYFTNGGGIFIDNASPTVKNNIIQNNVACNGGGIAIQDTSSAVITDNVIANNRADCSQVGGSGGLLGGGIYLLLQAGSAQILRNTITDNVSVDGGGIGIFLGGSTLVRDNSVLRNRATEANITTPGCTSAPTAAGIEILNGSPVFVVQNVVADNIGGCAGGVAWSVGDDSTAGPRAGAYLINNTVAQNTGVVASGIFVSWFGHHGLISNNVVVGTPGKVALFCVAQGVQIASQIDHNDFFGAGGADNGGTCGSFTGMNGNISADPNFAASSNDNFRPLPGSPVIDVGSNSAPNLPPFDFDGGLRIQPATLGGSPIIDMGAYEYSPQALAAVAVPTLSALASILVGLVLGTAGCLTLLRRL